MREYQEAMNTLKDAFIRAPVLISLEFFDAALQIVLHVDVAAMVGCGQRIFTVLGRWKLHSARFESKI